MPNTPPTDDAFVHAIERPHPRLWTYYIVTSLLFGPAMPFVLVYSYFRFHTMRYRFDDEGISMSWGVLFRREINLTYARIQDIHLTSNIVERWLGLARIQVQTASGSSGAEMTIEGIREFEALRDFLYTKMRGTKPALAAAPARAAHEGEDSAELVGILRDVAAELRALRIVLQSDRSGRRDG